MKTITKKDIIIALKTEKLITKQFVDGAFVNTFKNCGVCAVGAVLRKAGKNNIDIYRFGNKMMNLGYTSNCSTRLDIQLMMKSKQYLHALSCYWEKSKSRKKTIDFVKKNFPNRIKIDPAF